VWSGAQKRAKSISGGHHKNFNKDRLILYATKCRPMILVFKNIKYTRIFVRVP